MKKIVTLVVLIAFFLPIISLGQKNNQLYIDDTFPDSTFSKVMNYHKNTIALSDFKNKLVVLDFFFTTCSVCIKSFPKLMQYQKEMRDDLQFVLVAHESAEKIQAYINKWEDQHKTKFTLPIITADTVLHQWLPHRFETYYVWVNPTGRIVAQSSYVFMNPDIIRGYLKSSTFRE